MERFTLITSKVNGDNAERGQRSQQTENSIDNLIGQWRTGRETAQIFLIETKLAFLSSVSAVIGRIACGIHGCDRGRLRVRLEAGRTALNMLGFHISTSPFQLAD